MKKVLVLGAGMVARPLVAYLTARPDLTVTVADVDGARAAALVAGAPNGRDADPRRARPRRRRRPDRRLRPARQPAALRVRARHRAPRRGQGPRSMVSASPRGDAGMDALDGAARAAGVALMPEVGLDPGLEHMAISRMVARVKARGGTVVAVPLATAAACRPPRRTPTPGDYKFSWNPMGAVEASSGRRALPARRARGQRPQHQLFREPLARPGPRLRRARGALQRRTRCRTPRSTVSKGCATWCAPRCATRAGRSPCARSRSSATTRRRRWAPRRRRTPPSRAGSPASTRARTSSPASPASSTSTCGRR